MKKQEGPMPREQAVNISSFLFFASHETSGTFMYVPTNNLVHGLLINLLFPIVSSTTIILSNISQTLFVFTKHKQNEQSENDAYEQQQQQGDEKFEGDFDSGALRGFRTQQNRISNEDTKSNQRVLSEKEHEEDDFYEGGVEKMENTVNAPETVELMKKEQKEKVRIAETIMNLLLKLDSVRVFQCSALREFRKSLIKRAIAIQEFVDQIQLVAPTQVASSAENENEMNDCVSVGEENNCLVNEVEEHEEEGEKMGMDDEREESVGTNLVEEEEKEDCVVKVKQEEEEEEEEEEEKGGDDGNKEMLKRMMEENEKMMNMMTQLFERNEMQTALLTSLTQRVEQLERAFTFDRLRRKKRRNLDAKSKLTHPKNGCN